MVKKFVLDSLKKESFVCESDWLLVLHAACEMNSSPVLLFIIYHIFANILLHHIKYRKLTLTTNMFLFYYCLKKLDQF